MKLTPWYPGHVKPVRVGVYERKYPDIYHAAVYSKWHGKNWGCGVYNIDQANREQSISAHQSLLWRGIAKEPK